MEAERERVAGEGLSRGRSFGRLELAIEAGVMGRRRYAIERRMEDPISPGLLDESDGLNPTRALILQGYYALRRTRLPIHIGTRDISAWIKIHEPHEALPSESLIRLTLAHAKLAHRAPGRPRHDGPAKVTGPPFLPAPRSHPVLARR
jgi:hypothetical protein